MKVKFAAINHVDWKVRRGDLRIITGRAFPRAVGSDFSGTVIAVGPGVTRFKVGDDVFGLARIKESGALGNVVLTKDTFMALKPGNVSFEAAACLGTPGVTAWNALVDKGKLSGGAQVFINGCAGAVGEAAVQIGQSFGSDVSGCCRASDIERMRSLGVRTVFDYRRIDLSKLARRFDIAFDTAAVMKPKMGTSLVKKRGVYLDINPTPARFFRSFFDWRLKPIVCLPRADILDELARLAGRGGLQLTVASIVPLREAIRFIAAVERGRRLGGKGLVALE